VFEFKDLKITFVTGVYPHPRRGVWPGIERLVEDLSDALVKKGVDISIVTSYRLGGKSDFETLPNGVKLYKVRSLLDYRPFALLGLNNVHFSSAVFGKYYKLLRDSDLVHVFAVSLIPVWPLKVSLPPILYYFPHLDRPKSLLDLLYVPHINFLLQLICQSSDIITAGVPEDSPQITEFLRFCHVPMEKMRFLFQGVDLNRFNPGIDATDVRRKFSGNTVLFAGSLNPRKGLIHLLRAVPKVVKEVPDVKFVFIGRIEREEYIKAIARKLNVEDHVFIEGFVPEAELPKYYKAADVLSCPSLREGYSLVCLEAMSCGTPVVGTNLGTISEIVGDTGMLVGEQDSDALAAGIITLLQDTALRKKLSVKAAQRIIENFTWDKAADKAVQVYKEAIELRKRSR
jgi:glycosyltransferase involved in cell wall biosynthesis